MTYLRALILGPVLALGLGFAGLTATAVAQSAPTCVPASLNISALQAGVITISPLPGTRDAAPQTQISFLGAPASELSVQSVTGTRSGAHPGRLLAYSQGDGASFLPSRPFVASERVTVRARLRVGGVSHPILDVFVIAAPDTISSTPERIHSGTAAQEQHFRSRSDLRPPIVTVTANNPGASPGDLFVAPYTGPGQAGPMILDPSGGLLWFKALPTDTFATDLRVQEYAGKPVLTWWQGNISVHGFGTGEGVIADSAYQDIAHVRAGNGHQVDLHEFQVTPQGTALVTAYFPVLCNLSSAGGSSYSGLTDGVMQEIDIKTGLVMYEWTSLDHVALSESYASPKSSTPPYPYDFFHINSINLDRDGSLLISSRNTWAIYDVAASTGDINWRLGGKKSNFKAGPGTRTAWQHDPRELPDGTISLFDNGSSPTVHPQSRGIVIRLDPATGEATLVTQIFHTPALVVESQGNTQALANGDWFLGWGQEPFFSEVSPQGTTLFDAHFPVHTQSYRSFRFPWLGVPVHPPAFAYVSAGKGAGTAYASWNGATLVASWRLLAGASAKSLRPILTAPRAGFETAIALPGGTSGPYLAVQALDAAGNVLGSAAAVSEPGL
jgi:Arylsulfotransferase (ASST)